jgi:FtsP/CotA-like multicopper oxidase with cupredoxin domain
MKKNLFLAIGLAIYSFTPAQDLNGMNIAATQNLSVKIMVDNTPPLTVRYDLYVADTIVNYTGKIKHAIAINGSIPAPTLYFTEGDTAEIYVHNTLKEETSIHWHGIILPNQYDGVPYLTTQPVKAGQTHLFKFPILQNGTYWYHSHTKLQEQTGMYGALILHKRKAGSSQEKTGNDAEYTMLLSDWADMKPMEIERSLHNATDWFAIRKGSTQNYAQAIKEGYFKTKLTNEWKRMLAMDVSDVYYDRLLTNGRRMDEQSQFRSGDSVKLRIVNGSSSTYFWLTYAGGKITVVANDGMDVEPVKVDRLIIAVAETYDVIVTIPDNRNYEFLATAEDRTQSTSLWLGSGMRMNAAPLPKLKYFEGMKMMNGMMKMNGDMDPMGMEMSNQTMDMNGVMYPEITGMEKKTDAMKMDNPGDMVMPVISPGIITLNYGMLRSAKKTNLTDGPTKLLHFTLTGNMNRYVWSIDNKTVGEADKILIKKGENVKIILYNETMMRHPMHLHGHFFRVLNGQGDHSPLKNTLDIMPMETDTLEFAATESGDWFFHCHILYHMMSGMGRIFSYENSPPNPEVPDPKYALHKLYQDEKMPHFMARVGIENNGSDGEAMLENTRYKLSTMWHLGYHDMHGYESETMFGRYLGKMQWWFPYVGFDYHFKKEGGPKNIFGSEEKNWFGQVSNKSNRKTVVAGIAYTLPLLFIADARIDGKGKFRFQLSRQDIPITSRLRLTIMLNTDKEYMAGFRYVVSKYFSLSTHYDCDMGLGAGVTITY